MTIVALYAPLDGMNEEGLCVSVNMIEDSDTIDQNTKARYYHNYSRAAALKLSN